VSGVLQGFCGGGMGTEFRIEVSEDSDANGVTHVVIVLERDEVVGGSRLEAWCGAARRPRGCEDLAASGLRREDTWAIVVRVEEMDAESRFLALLGMTRVTYIPGLYSSLRLE